MQKYFILFVAFFLHFSCNMEMEKNALPPLLDLEFIDSAAIKEDAFFLNGQFRVQLVGDSLIGVSSVKSPGVGFYTIYGKQRKRIASGDYPIGSFLPSYFDASEYPIVYILDKRSESVLVFQVEKQELLRKIRLELPEGKEVKIMDSKLKKIKNGFLIELASSKFEQMDPNYYQQTGTLIYFFDENGKPYGEPFLEYPDVIKNIGGSLSASNYLSMGNGDKYLSFTFPHEQRIRIFDKKNLRQQIGEIKIPQSRYFNFQLKGAERIYSLENNSQNGFPEGFDVPKNHYFNSIFSSRDLYVIQTWLIGDESEGLDRRSHLMVYNKNEEKWFETKDPRNILDMGMLAGVVQDTLYFFEGSLMKSDEKYIKRAVLNPVKN